ncbi:MAG: calcium/sodium antiporter [Candidatus Riflebacteria bacterium]|nr:calcium/sodium antiporter [Candidatus Riflebacteria bacterium]
MFWNLFRIALGFGLLTKGAGWFVDGSVAIARRLRIPPYVIGATLVALGTSLPELVTSVYAGLAGRPEIALANVVGSNLVNVGIVVGMAALLCPMLLDRDVFVEDAPHLLVSAFLLAVMAADGRIERAEGVLLLFLGLVYAVSLVRQREGPEDASGGVSDEGPASLSPIGIAWRLAAGMAGFTLGAKALVDGASELARAASIPEWLIGLTVVAVGTSLPELATSVAAAYRGSSSIAVGNVFGSNILNIYVVLGLTASLAPVTVAPATLGFDVPALVAMTFTILFVVNGRKVTREHGLVLIAAYLAILLASLRVHPTG